LKRVYERVQERAEEGFQPTYEGLKQGMLLKKMTLPKGFQPTYEGLKLLWIRLSTAGGGVSSLPTRD